MFKRGDLIKAAAVSHAAAAASATSSATAARRAGAQYWYAYYDKSIGLVVKADADHIWVRWFRSVSLVQDTHKYYNKTKYFKLVSRNGQF